MGGGSEPYKPVHEPTTDSQSGEDETGGGAVLAPPRHRSGMKGTQTVFAGHSLIRRLRRAIQGYSESDFDLPSRDADFLDEEAQEFSTLVELQSAARGPDCAGEAFDSGLQRVLSSQLLPLVDQRSPLRFESGAAQFQLLAPA